MFGQPDHLFDVILGLFLDRLLNIFIDFREATLSNN